MLALAAGLSLFTACGSSDVSRELGAQCQAKRDCDERCLSGEDFPSGMCTLSCETDQDCPTLSRCIDAEGGVCLYRCQVPADCEFLGTGWNCLAQERREVAGEEVLVCIGG